MSQSTTLFDGERIHFESSGNGETALLFVHGWLGNLHWWDYQKDAFSKNFQVVQMDLAGHGKSSAQRKDWSIRAYAEDIKAVVEKLGLKKVVLVGHSMSGSNVIEAYHLMPEWVPMLILVDTLQDLDHMPSQKDVAPLFDGMRKDFKGTVETSFPHFMFAKTSPPAVLERIVREAKSAPPSVAISSLEPFYATDVREACSRVQVPVRAINSDLYPTNTSVCRKYFSDFDCEIISGVGHYPMLEAPQQFNDALGRLLKRQKVYSS